MRDALSLLDQAIAYGGGGVSEAEVREMLGVVDTRYLERLLDALLRDDGPALVGVADEMLSNNAPFGRTLSELAGWLQRIALAQVGASGEDEEAAALARFAREIPAETLQVYYQIAIHGARDLPLAPDEHAGFAMTLLRMLAFRPVDAQATAVPPAPAGQPPRQATPPETARAAARAASGLGASAARARSRGAEGSRAAPAATIESAVAGTPAATSSQVPEAAASGPPGGSTGPAREFDGDWTGLATQLRLGGFALQFMQQSELVGRDGLSLRVRVPIRPLAEPLTVNKVRDALCAHFGAPVRLSVEVGTISGPTAAAVASRKRERRLDEARTAIESDPFVQTLLSDFGGRIVPDSVEPIDP